MDIEKINANKLVLFKNAINKQANEELRRLSAADKEKQEAVNRARADSAARDAISEIRTEANIRSTRFRKEFSRCDFETKKAVRAHRNELITAFFADIEEELARFAQSEKYGGYLKNAIAEAEKQLGGEFVILAAPRDVEAVKALTSREVREDRSIRIGGVCGEDAARGLFCDCTLDRALADEITAFTSKSELADRS